MKIIQKQILLLISFLIILLTGCTSSGIHLFTVQIAGEVRESSILAQPIESVRILNKDGQELGQTNSAGKFLVKASAVQGVVHLTFSHQDYESLTLDLAIDGSYTQLVELPPLELKLAGQKISGRIYRQLITPKVLTHRNSSPQPKNYPLQSTAEVVEAEYNLVTQRGEIWLLDLLDGKGQIQYASGDGFYTIKLYPGVPAEELIAELEINNDIEFITPNYYLQSMAVVSPPKTELDLWNMQMLDINSAWKYSTGSGVVVAVLDSLYTTTHPDLAPNLLPARDFSGDLAYTDVHGLHVAGIIGAAANGFGVVGVAPEVSILPIRVFNRSQTAEIKHVVQAIELAIDLGVDVINLSLGVYDIFFPENDFPDLHYAIKKAYDAGIVMVAAAGNDNTNYLLYPAAYPEVIAVGALNHMGERASYSQYGQGLEVMAPGGDENAGIISIGEETPTYETLSGTSMAAPHVSGAVALLIANGITDPDYIRQILRETAIDLGDPGYDLEYGYGLIDPFAILHRFAHSYVFFGDIITENAQIKSQVFQVEINGDFQLSGVRPGIGRVVGWVDLNNNFLIDGGDYFGQSEELEVFSGMDDLCDINIELKLIPGEFSAIDIDSIIWNNSN